MRELTGYELLWLFMIYSFAGWIFETIVSIIRKRKSVDNGFIDGPFCVTYGFSAVLIILGLRELTGIWLFLFAAAYATVIEWIGGHVFEKIWKRRRRNYSAVKWNLDGYICLPASAVWGVLGYTAMRWGNGLLLTLYDWMPRFVPVLIIWIFIILLIVDIMADIILLRGKSKRLEQWRQTNDNFADSSRKLKRWLAGKVNVRLARLYYRIEHREEKRAQTVFAEGCSFYKIVLLFIIGSLLGDIVETIFCRMTAGVWMSRSSLIWGPFSVVWGMAIALATALLYKYKDSSDGFIFAIGTFLGGAYEYLCSVLSEIVFGKVFWDYSALPFNLGGRINLLYCFFWGIAAVVWLKRLYPLFSKWIEKIPVKPGKIITWCLIVFMCVNCVASAMALVRYDEREKGVSAEYSWQEWMDTHYDDAKMQIIYPNAISTE